jgi:hypothetical protein
VTFVKHILEHTINLTPYRQALQVYFILFKKRRRREHGYVQIIKERVGWLSGYGFASHGIQNFLLRKSFVVH